ncbi:MAG: peptidoglycan-binding protein, partial [Clostridia bacterium]|nr:peptidoglycan-binding protein [Clostridia bacterium]
MNKRRGVKWMLAVMLLVLPLILSGCYVTPDIQNGNNNGNTGIGDFPTFAPATTQPPIPTQIPVTNAPQGGISTPIGGTITVPTQNPGLITVPTDNGWAPVVIPTVPSGSTQITITMPPIAETPAATAQGVLKLGSQGDQVREVQRLLKNLKFYDGLADGDFGPGTEAAVKAFQTQYKLTADGVVGSSTFTKLYNATATKKPEITPTPQGSLKLESTGDDVREVQRRLKSLGFYAGSVDGDFGAGTEAAVKAFQKQYGLTADGKVGQQTMNALRNARATAKPANKPAAAGSNATAVPSYNENTYLRKGNSSSDVRKMQERLISLGYLSGNATGTF